MYKSLLFCVASYKNFEVLLHNYIASYLTPSACNLTPEVVHLTPEVVNYYKYLGSYVLESPNPLPLADRV